jgi:diaminobutyrate-2-oxoglutarate transaminase
MRSGVIRRRGSVFERRESQVRSYARAFPVQFASASGSFLYDADGRRYIDFLAGCASLNYGHNDPAMKAALMAHIAGDGIAQGLDLETPAKGAFLEAFERLILAPRGLKHRVQFTGPTGANAIEAALKLARRITGRSEVVAFTNGYHGVSLGALAATGNRDNRGAAGTPLGGVFRAPFEGYHGDGVDTLAMVERMLADPSSGLVAPAAFMVETVQGEGGLNAASADWLRRLTALSRRHGALLIVDDIQAGCGRTGDFFSFEEAGIEPDLITLSKSLSGFGLPMSVLLIAPEHDVWRPAEHNGTFRGNNHAFVTARIALEKFWSDGELSATVRRRAELVRMRLEAVAALVPDGRVKGRGMMSGVDLRSGELSTAVRRHCFAHGLIIEGSGGFDEVVKVLAPLTTPDEVLEEGLAILDDCVRGALARGEQAA